MKFFDYKATTLIAFSDLCIGDIFESDQGAIYIKYKDCGIESSVCLHQKGESVNTGNTAPFPPSAQVKLRDDVELVAGA